MSTTLHIFLLLILSWVGTSYAHNDHGAAILGVGAEYPRTCGFPLYRMASG